MNFCSSSFASLSSFAPPASHCDQRVSGAAHTVCVSVWVGGEPLVVEGVAIASGLMMQFSGSGVTKQHKGRDYSN